MHVRRAFTHLWTKSLSFPLSGRLFSGIPPFSPSTTGQNHLGSVTFTENGHRIRLKSCSDGPRCLSVAPQNLQSKEPECQISSDVLGSFCSFSFSGPGDFTRSHTIQKRKKKPSWLDVFKPIWQIRAEKTWFTWFFYFFFIIIVSTCYWHNSVARSVFQFRTTLGPVLSQRWDGSQLSFVQLLTSCRGWILKSLIPRPLLELNYEVEILCLNTLQRNLAHIFMVPKVIL